MPVFMADNGTEMEIYTAGGSVVFTAEECPQFSPDKIAAIVTAIYEAVDEPVPSLPVIPGPADIARMAWLVHVARTSSRQVTDRLFMCSHGENITCGQVARVLLRNGATAPGTPPEGL